MDGRLGHYQSLKEHGEKLLDKHHFASEDIQGILKQLDSTWITLNEAWDERKRLLTQCYDLQVRGWNGGWGGRLWKGKCPINTREFRTKHRVHGIGACRWITSLAGGSSTLGVNS